MFIAMNRFKVHKGEERRSSAAGASAAATYQDARLE
jgi:hypothetical protein